MGRKRTNDTADAPASDLAQIDIEEAVGSSATALMDAPAAAQPDRTAAERALAEVASGAAAASAKPASIWHEPAPASSGDPKRAPKRRGRKPRAELEAELQSARAELARLQPSQNERLAALPGELAAAMLTSFGVLADVRGVPEWQISEQNALRLGEAWAPIAAEYLDGSHNKALLWGAALLTSYAVLRPGIMAERRRRRPGTQSVNVDRVAAPVAESPEPATNGEPVMDATYAGADPF